MPASVAMPLSMPGFGCTRLPVNFCQHVVFKVGGLPCLGGLPPTASPQSGSSAARPTSQPARHPKSTRPFCQHEPCATTPVCGPTQGLVRGVPLPRRDTTRMAVHDSAPLGRPRSHTPLFFKRVAAPIIREHGPTVSVPHPPPPPPPHCCFSVGLGAGWGGRGGWREARQRGTRNDGATPPTHR